jgi:hypothetical protein
MLKLFRSISMLMLLLLAVNATSEAAGFKRYTAGAPGVLPTPAYWQWNPDGNLPIANRIFPCDGALYRLAIVNVTVTSKILNTQYVFSADPGEFYLTLGLRDNGTMFDSKTVLHPAPGFGFTGGGNFFKRFIVPKTISSGHTLEFVGRCSLKAGYPNPGGECGGIACAAGTVLYGLETTTTAPIGLVGNDANLIPMDEQVHEELYSMPAGTYRQVALSTNSNGSGNGVQPMSYLTTPDGQMAALFTTEDYWQQGGGFAYNVDFSPDWIVLPAGNWKLTMDQRWHCNPWPPCTGSEGPWTYGLSVYQ